MSDILTLDILNKEMNKLKIPHSPLSKKTPLIFLSTKKRYQRYKMIIALSYGFKTPVRFY